MKSRKCFTVYHCSCCYSCYIFCCKRRPRLLFVTKRQLFILLKEKRSCQLLLVKKDAKCEYALRLFVLFPAQISTNICFLFEIRLFCFHWRIISLVSSINSLNSDMSFSENKTMIFTCLENPSRFKFFCIYFGWKQDKSI